MICVCQPIHDTFSSENFLLTVQIYLGHGVMISVSDTFDSTPKGTALRYLASSRGRLTGIETVNDREEPRPEPKRESDCANARSAARWFNRMGRNQRDGKKTQRHPYCDRRMAQIRHAKEDE